VTGKPIRAVFFDAGLTLIHSQPTLAERYIQALEQRGIAATVEQVQAALKRAGALMLEASRADPDIWAADDKVQKHWQDFYVNAFRDLGAGPASEACAQALYDLYNRPGAWSLFPDVLPTLKRLHVRGYVIGVISDWATSLPANILLPLGVGPYIDFMVVSATMREAKPSSGLYREALARAGAHPHEAVHVGDSYVNDILGARAAGIAGVLLDRDRLYNEPLDCPRIVSLEELPALLASMGT
jgi:FMN phosphatase YigB (HAD superfamily)